MQLFFLKNVTREYVSTCLAFFEMTSTVGVMGVQQYDHAEMLIWRVVEVGVI